MNIYKKIERSIKTLFWIPFILKRHGTLRPSHIIVTSTGGTIFFSPTDKRAIKKLVYETARNRIPDPVVFWRDFIDHLQPDFALDIGVNYGECLFGIRYPENCHVIGCEANPAVMPFIERSKATHPSAESIEIISGIVSDVMDKTQDFFVNPSWSGSASVVTPDAKVNHGRDIYQLPTVRLDSLILPEKGKDKIIVFKMDIEGSEHRAMLGFEETLKHAQLVVGFMEFDSGLIRRAGSNAAEFLTKLLEDFVIYRLTEKASKVIVPVESIESLPQPRKLGASIHTDLILVSRKSSACNWLPKDWKIA